jgi:hypothetical protein
MLQNFQVAEQLVASQDEFSPMELVIAFKPTPEPLCPLMKGVQGMEMKQTGHEADDSHLSSTKIKNVWSYIFTPHTSL